MKGISVIICCYNSESRIVETLKYLTKQNNINGITYELILVDNNCTDSTVSLVLKTWLELGDLFPLIIEKQPIPGLKYAREKGVQKSKYEYIIFCDDDNWLCEDYLSKAYSLFEAFPAVAIIGGVGEAICETPAPKWFIDLNGFGYAVGESSEKTGFVNSVYGAGMGLRKSIYLSIITSEFSSILIGRNGKALSSGEDIEICILITNAGHQIYLDHSLRFKHYLTSNRLNWKYYLHLRSSFGKANAYLSLYQQKSTTEQSFSKNSLLIIFFSTIKFAILNYKYFIFPYHFKNSKCANFWQDIGKRKTLIFDNRKLIKAKKQIVSNNF